MANKNLPWILGGAALVGLLVLMGSRQTAEPEVIGTWTEGNLQFRLIEVPDGSLVTYRYERSDDGGKSWSLVETYPTLTSAVADLGPFDV